MHARTSRLLIGLSIVAVAALPALAAPAHSVAADAARETLLHVFDTTADGSFPSAPIIRGRDGNYYGTTRVGPIGDSEFGPYPTPGSIYRMSPQGVTTLLYTFSSYDLSFTNGEYPSFGALAEDKAGNLYGMTMYGGAYGLGVIYRFSRDGQFTVLHDFDGSDGVTPYGGLVFGNDGNLYGTSTGATTVEVPLANLGSVFRVTPRGKVTPVHAFTGHGDSAVPVSLMLASDGNLYGTTASQANLGLSAADRGSIFRISPDGLFTTLHLFTGGSDGSLPVALTEDNGLF